MKNINFKPLSLLLAGALLGVLGGLVRECIKPFWIYLLIFSFLLILYGSGSTSILWNIYLRYRKNKRIIGKHLIGILNDIPWNVEYREISSWTNTSPNNWMKTINDYAKAHNLNIKAKLVNIGKNLVLPHYIAILNPYGGVYPESDTKEFIGTLDKIFSYVKEGGLFINVADIPGYYLYNSLLKRRLDTTPTIYGPDLRPQKPFAETPFMKRLGLQILDTDQDDDLKKWKLKIDNDKEQEVKIQRVVIVEKNVKSIIETKTKRYIFVDPSQADRKSYSDFSFSSFFYIYYGNGKFLILLGSDNYLDNNDVKNWVIKIILDTVKE